MNNIWLLLTSVISMSALSVYYWENPYVLLLFVLIGLLTFSEMRSQVKKIAFILSLLCVMIFYCQNIYHDFARSQELGRIEGKAVVVEAKDSYYILSRGKIFGKRNFSKIYLYWKKPLRLGQEIYFRGKVLEKERQMTPGSFDQKKYDLSSNIKYRIQGTSVEEMGLNSKVDALKEQWKSNLQGRFGRYLMDRHSQIISAMVLGSRISMEEIGDFQELGLLHILSISGLHIGILLYLLHLIAKKLSFPSTLRWIFTHSLILSYMYFVNFPIGALRVYLMLLFGDIGKALSKPVEKDYLLFFSSSIFLLKNPFVIFNYSFLFTFLSVWSIYKVAPIYRRFFASLNKYIGSGLSLSLGVNTGIFPLILSLQGKISLIGMGLNILLVPAFSLLIVLSFALLLSSFISSFFASLIGQSIDGILGLSLYIMEISQRYFQSFYFRPFNVLESMVYYGAIGLWVFPFYKKWNRKYIYMLMGQIFGSIVLIACVFFLNRPQAKVYFLYVGQGDASYVETPSYQALIDTGGSSFSFDPGSKYTLAFFRSQGIHQIDDLFISHFDSDHIQGIFSLAKEVNIKRIHSNHIPQDKSLYNKIENTIGKIHVEQDLQGKGQGIVIQSLDNYRGKGEENERSMVLKILLARTSFLFMGDLPKAQEKDILNKLGPIDVIKLGHHGSNTSTSRELIEKTHPRLAIISAGRNNSYGHPSPEVLDLLREEKIPYRRTDKSGTIELSIKDNRLYCKEFMGEQKRGIGGLISFFLYFVFVSFLGRILIEYLKKGANNEYKTNL